MSHSSHTFGTLLAHYLDLAHMTQLQFAEQAGLSKGFPSLLINDKRTPPLAKIDEWADILGLSDKKRKRLHQAAQLAHAPRQVKERIERYEAKISQLQDEISRLKKQR